MENMLKTPPKVPIQTPTPTTTTTEPECKTPTLPVQQLHNSDDHKSPNELRKPVTPDRLRVPKAFKYPERYTSPTDMLISPVTKGLLARNKRGGALLPPGKFQPKVPDLCLQDVSPLENKLPLLIDEKNNST